MLISILLIVFIISGAIANVGIPMLTYELPIFIVALPLVVFIEARVYKNKLSLSYGTGVREAFWSNILSTFAGVPITWALLVAIQFVVGGAGFLFDPNTLFEKLGIIIIQGPWLLPFGKDLHWLVPAAGMFLLIPFFFASWMIEYWNIARRVSKGLLNLDKLKLKHAVFVANLQSYILLFLIWIFAGLISLSEGYPELMLKYLGEDIFNVLNSLAQRL